MHRMPSHPPAEYADFDDFLWREFSTRACWASWVAQRYAIDIRTAARNYEAAKQLQAALRALQYVNNGADEDASAAARLNTMIAWAKVRPVVRGDGSTLLRAASGAVADMLVVALTVMGDGSWKRFKRCLDRSCSASFYDTSKNATRVWCSMARCGARAKMRRLRHRADDKPQHGHKPRTVS